MTPAWVVFGFSLACVPLSIFGFFASWTENRKALRAYGSIAGFVAASFLGLLVYVAVAYDLSEVVTNQCAELLTFVHEDWWAADWGGGIDCAKYAGSALVWSSKETEYQETDGGVGLFASLRCEHKKDDVYAWERNSNSKQLASGPNCEHCVASYGCLNRDCCAGFELELKLEQT